MAITFHIRELFCVKWTTKRQRKRGETFFYTFCTISFLFPPLRPLSTECAEYAFHGQEALEPARTENREKRHKAGEKGRERERNVPFFLLYCNIERWIYYPENLTDFFFLYPGVPGTQSYHYNQNTWTVQQFPTLTLRKGREKKESAPSKVHQSVFLSHHPQLVLMWDSQWWNEWELWFSCGLRYYDSWQ